METDVVVIGGGATAGLGVAWDLTLRGLRVTLVKMGDVGTGTSGRYHGQLHTGARYAASDLKSARECWQEHTTIRKIVPPGRTHSNVGKGSYDAGVPYGAGVAAFAAG